MAVNEFLAQYFGTNATPDMIEEQTKQAEAETFVQLAKEAGVPLHQMTDAQIAELYEHVMGKTAESEEDDEEEKKRKAAEEYASKKESHVKFAEATEMGQIMAHSFWNELGEIEKDAYSLTEAGMKGRDALKRGWKGLKRIATGKELRSGLKMRGAAKSENAAAKVDRYLAKKTQGTESGERLQAARKMILDDLKERGTSKALRGGAKTLGLYGGGAALAGGGAAAVAGREKDSAAALNELALELAVEKCASAGWDADEAATRIVSVINLDLVGGENTKIAYANDVDGAVEIRALELIEAAGYPVTWE